MKGNVWFRRLRAELESKSPHLRFKEIKLGFYRIYYKGFYIGEVYSCMPPKGYDIEEEDPRLVDRYYYEEHEDKAKLTRNIKNFVEGYFDTSKDMATRLYMLRNDAEFYENSKKAYQEMRVK